MQNQCYSWLFQCCHKLVGRFAKMFPLGGRGEPPGRVTFAETRTYYHRYCYRVNRSVEEGKEGQDGRRGVNAAGGGCSCNRCPPVGGLQIRGTCTCSIGEHSAAAVARRTSTKAVAERAPSLEMPARSLSSLFVRKEYSWPAHPFVSPPPSRQSLVLSLPAGRQRALIISGAEGEATKAPTV